VSPLGALGVTLGVLVAGVVLVGLLDALARLVLGPVPLETPDRLTLEGLRGAVRRQSLTTEHPDLAAWRLAPAAYLGLAAAGLALVPVAADRAAVDVEAGIVVWGAVESLTVIAVFLHGWSSNSLLPLLGAYRFVAIGLSVMLVSMFVLIGAALPAESLRLTAIVESQRGLWNAVRQPLGLPLFLLLGLAITLRGPMDYADSADLAGGTSAEDSGAPRLAWQFARAAMLVAFATMAATVFLGGPLGPLLPGPVWLLLKAGFVAALLVALGRLLARPDASRMLTFIWVVLLPLSFLDLAIAGLETLR
jgi:NADH-quinone oxidoreductase subunit H